MNTRTATLLVMFAAILLASGPVALGITTQECETGADQARSEGPAFKSCILATPGTIDVSCCTQLSALAQYADCLDIPEFQSEANSFLEPETSLSAVQSACIGDRRR